MGESQKLYEYAKTIIPGATQLLSKRAERFAPGIWPSYYSKAKGCEVWDLDGNHFYDFASMGIGSCTLGYANEHVNEAVKEAVNLGNMCTLNCREEIVLAEKLIELHPWSEMVRYARTGGEACSIAVRIARAATGKSKVFFCGYHGWHDWYISANISCSSNLDNQLLPNMTTKGVPQELKGTAFSFSYNDSNSLVNLFNQYGNDVACVIFEPQRGTKPEKQFLDTIKEYARKYKAVVICDEVTSGFRMNIGGIHLAYNFEPDIAVFGKAIANGYAMAAIIGKKSVMHYAEESFISSAFWTERIGPVAALSTIEQMKRLDSPNILVSNGNAINDIWNKAAKDFNININITGIPPLTHLDFDYPNNYELQTYYIQLMLSEGFLVGPSVYTTIAYTKEIIEKFDKSTNKAFHFLSNAINNDHVPLLSGVARTDAFKRLVY